MVRLVRLRFMVSNLYISNVSHLEILLVFNCIESDDNTSRINRACCVSTSTKTDSLPNCRPLSVAGEAESKTCKLSANSWPPPKPSNHCRDRPDLPNKSDRHSGGSKSIRATGKLLTYKEEDQKEEHQPKSKTSAVPCTTCEQ